MASDIKSILPVFCPHKIIEFKKFGGEGEKFECALKCKLTKKEEVNLWVKCFRQSTHTIWQYRCPADASDYELAADYVCRTVQTKGRGDCRAHIKFRIKKVSDEQLAPALPCRIKILFIHNHSVASNNSSTVKITDPDSVLQFYSYFQTGMTPVSARKFHTLVTLVKDSKHAQKTSKANLPWVFSLYSHWLSLSHHNAAISENGPDLHRLLMKRKEEVEREGGSLLFNVTPLSMVLVTGMMKRVLQRVQRYGKNRKYSPRVAFFVESFSPHASDETITVILAPCKLGALPVTICVHKNTTAKDYTQVFDRVKHQWAALKVFEVDFVCENNPRLREGLTNTWKNCDLLMPRWLPMVMVWNTANPLHNDWDKWLAMVSSFKRVTAARGRRDTEMCMDQVMGAEVCRVHRPYRELLQFLFNNASEWCDSLRQTPHFQSNFTDLTVRITKAFLIRTVKYFNLPALINFFTVLFDKLVQCRVVDLVYDRSTNIADFLCDYPFNKTHLVQENGMFRTWTVAGSKDGDVRIDPDCVMCSCPASSGGGFCKHLSQASNNSIISLPFKPSLTNQNKELFLRIALGQQIPEGEVPELSSIHITCDLDIVTETEFTFAQSNPNLKRRVENDNLPPDPKKPKYDTTEDNGEQMKIDEFNVSETLQTWKNTMNNIEGLIMKNMNNTPLLHELSTFLDFMGLANSPTSLERVLKSVNSSNRLLPKIMFEPMAE